MKDGVDRVLRASRTKGAELRNTAATKGGELGRTAAAKGSEVGRTAATMGADIGRAVKQLDVPWARCGVARMLRETILQFGLVPLLRLYTRLRVYGRERFEQIPAPVVFVANHSSH